MPTMNTTTHRIFKMAFARVYPMYVQKLVEELAKGRKMEKILRQ